MLLFPPTSREEFLPESLTVGSRDNCELLAVTIHLTWKLGMFPLTYITYHIIPGTSRSTQILDGKNLNFQILHHPLISCLKVVLGQVH